ncbi:ATP-binding protein [Aureimonas leprariae]|uniref:ATP-binding protein n=1 Tax=Plantimonas leprariae TaxID=2615207 RepID=A0A7V7PPB5_9HYPH|nr:ATP-binding protein [Aureimonas leprariae]KAB0679692.1 ATP-binding protein [Aureimonas leprariae]
MEPRDNPYAPGAGTQPPELAGRDDVIERVAVARDRFRAGRSARSMIGYGLRGVGKTVLLAKMRRDAAEAGFPTVWIEAPEGRSFPGLLIPPLRAALLRLDRGQAALAAGQRAMRALAGFARSVKMRYGDVEFGIDIEPEPGLADSGDLELDLQDLLRSVGEAAQARETVMIIAVDELQYVPEEQLAALIAALHAIGRDQLPVMMIAAGLPQLLGQMGRAKSYAERLFEFVSVDRLSTEAATDALCLPANELDVSYEPDAIEEILRQTQGYPYFLQEWGKHAWLLANASPIRREHAQAATPLALADLDASFFRVRFDRLTPAEKRYLRAMAELGPGPHRSGDIADRLQRKVTTMAPLRNSLILKGMIYSPSHGDTAFTVPLFDAFMKRIMPDFPIHA